MAERSYQKNRSPRRSPKRDYSRDYQITRGSSYDINLDPSMEGELPDYEFYEEPQEEYREEELGFPVDGKFKPISEMSDSELRSHEILYKRSGEPVPSEYRGDVQGLVPFNPSTLAFETLIMGASQEEPAAAVIGGLVAPKALSMARNVGKSMLKNRKLLIQAADDMRHQDELLDEFSELVGTRRPDFVSRPLRYMEDMEAHTTARALDPNIPSQLFNERMNQIRSQFQSIESRQRAIAMSVEDARNLAGIYRSGRPNIRGEGAPVHNIIKGQKAAEKFSKVKLTAGGSANKNYNLVVKEGNRITRLIRNNLDENRTNYSFSMTDEKGQGAARLSFISKKATYDPKTGNPLYSGKDVQIIENFDFYAGANKGTIQAGRLVKEFMKRLPKGSLIQEDSMTFDSLLLLLRTAVKENAKIMFDSGKIVKTNPSTKSFFSKYFSDVWASGSQKNKKEAFNKFTDHVDKMLSKANVQGKPDFRMKGTSQSIDYNAVRVQKVMGIAATSLGFKNYEEFEKFLNYDPNSVESKVFDDEISF